MNCTKSRLFFLTIAFFIPLYSFAKSSYFPTIQIESNLESFVGRPSWLLVLKDVDNNRTLAYLYDFMQEDNFWIAPNTGKNYLVVASTLQFNKPRKRPIQNFCKLESNGRIEHGKNMIIRIQGDLKPYSNTLHCYVTKY